MSRKKISSRKDILPDAKFSSIVISRFINYLMIGGKKYVAEMIAYRAISMLAEKLKKDPVLAFEEAIENLKPSIEVRSKRVGGSTYQIPIEVLPDRQVFRSLKWLITCAKGRRSERSMTKKVYLELYDAYYKKGAAYKKKEETHRMAESNKAFSHFRF